MSEMLPRVSIVFITYNRLITLKPTLMAFLANTDYPRDRLELIVSDDGSPPEIQEEIRHMPFDRFCLAEKQEGLGANTNRGLRVATGDYILQLQDDWECLGPPDYLRRALRAMDLMAEIGMVILYRHPCSLPVREELPIGNDVIRIYDNKPGSRIRLVGEHAYSDWPHIKRRSFLNLIGMYKECAAMWETELDFSRRVNAQTHYFIAEVTGMDAFRHIRTDLSFNRGSARARWAKKIESLWLGKPLLSGYRTVKQIIMPAGK